jgi:hypothetical protein
VKRSVTTWGALALVGALACSSPPPPVIPGRDVIGPPYAAQVNCPEGSGSARIAQSNFRIADLDRGTVCTGFIEQDECIVALYHDCTYDIAHARSWQGQIDEKMSVIDLYASYEHGGGVFPRSPNFCSGTLKLPASAPPWAMLTCQISGSAGMSPHSGFYVERADSTPIYHLMPPNGIQVVAPRMETEGFLPGMVVLSKAGQLWVIANGTSASGDASGLYSGPLGASSLTRAMSLNGPTILRATADEAWLFIATGSELLRVSPQNPSQPMMVRASGPIVDLAIVGSSVLVAVNAPPNGTRLQAYTIDPLAPAGMEQPLSFAVTGILPLTTTGTIAILASTSSELTPLSFSLTPGQSFAPIQGSTPTAYTLVDANTLALAYISPNNPASTHYLEIGVGPKNTLLDLFVPDASEVQGLACDAQRENMVTVSKGGTVQVIDRMGPRTVLGSEVVLPDHAPASHVVYDPKTDAFFVLAGSTGVVYPLVR